MELVYIWVSLQGKICSCVKSIPECSWGLDREVWIVSYGWVAVSMYGLVCVGATLQYGVRERLLMMLARV